MRIGNNIISDDHTYDDTQDNYGGKIFHHDTENGVQNFGRVFPPDQENLSNELTDNIYDKLLINPNSIVVQEEGTERVEARQASGVGSAK